MWTEMSSPSLVTAEERCNLTQLLALRAAQSPTQIYAEIKDDDDSWHPVTLRRIPRAGHAPSRRASSPSASRQVTASASWATPATSGPSSTSRPSPRAPSRVPIYPSSSSAQVAWILADAGVTFVATDSAERADAVTAASGTAP